MFKKHFPQILFVALLSNLVIPLYAPEATAGAVADQEKKDIQVKIDTIKKATSGLKKVETTVSILTAGAVLTGAAVGLAVTLVGTFILPEFSSVGKKVSGKLAGETGEALAKKAGKTADQLAQEVAAKAAQEAAEKAAKEAAEAGQQAGQQAVKGLIKEATDDTKLDDLMNQFLYEYLLEHQDDSISKVSALGKELVEQAAVKFERLSPEKVTVIKDAISKSKIAINKELLEGMGLPKVDIDLALEAKALKMSGFSDDMVEAAMRSKTAQGQVFSDRALELGLNRGSISGSAIPDDQIMSALKKVEKKAITTDELKALALQELTTARLDSVKFARLKPEQVAKIKTAVKASTIKTDDGVMTVEAFLTKQGLSGTDIERALQKVENKAVSSEELVSIVVQELTKPASQALQKMKQALKVASPFDKQMLKVFEIAPSQASSEALQAAQSYVQAQEAALLKSRTGKIVATKSGAQNALIIGLVSGLVSGSLGAAGLVLFGGLTASVIFSAFTDYYNLKNLEAQRPGTLTKEQIAALDNFGKVLKGTLGKGIIKGVGHLQIRRLLVEQILQENPALAAQLPAGKKGQNILNDYLHDARDLYNHKATHLIHRARIEELKKERDSHKKLSLDHTRLNLEIIGQETKYLFLPTEIKILQKKIDSVNARYPLISDVVKGYVPRFIQTIDALTVELLRPE